MKQPALDIALSDGLAYMVANADYQAHLLSAVESKETKEVLVQQSSSR
ncbi:hypothetical protein AZE42_13649 [Rhizopogon vesiculosus]|uniref:Uncharacterized protein n=1 Tax=Rhizopogon vesiculosus TaxID=180088 RepID=A0A1J8QQ77_9AGAM|nr:hypothetical protein AZE42_13649 [Rhizopogon vesiculosus]